VPLLAVTAGDVVAAAADFDVDIGHLAPPVFKQPVDLADRAFDPAAQRLMGPAQLLDLGGIGGGGLRLAGRSLDARQSALDPADGV
jgi:hypothetical protein